MRRTRSQTQAENALHAQKNTTPGGSNGSSNTSVTTTTAMPIPHTPTVRAPVPNADTTSINNSRSGVRSQAQKRKATPTTPATKVSAREMKEFEYMLNYVRIAELQKILAYLHITFHGRKLDLQRHILNLLPEHYEVLSAKIKEVYSTFIKEQHITNIVNDRILTGQININNMYSHMHMPTVQQNPAALVNSSVVPQVGQQQMPGNGGVNPGNVVPFLQTIPTQMPIHPDVTLKKLAFYDVLGTLIKPSSLVPRSTQRIQEVPFYFTLTPQQASEIASSRDIRNPNKVEYIVQVQVRFCLLETSCEQEDCFPPSVTVKVNNKLCQLPNVIPTNRPNVEPKRPPRPVNVTSNVKLSPTVTNTITVQWCPDYTRGYCLAVYLVQKLTSAQLLHRMKTKGVKPADYTRALIKEKLTEDADCEIATTMLKVSLNCPLGKMKMSIPCRASTCSHLQCFDASLYLQMNERKPTWNCPVCDRPAVYDNLVIDGYFQEVLASPLLTSDDTEIQLHKDGSWSTHNLRNEGQIIDTPTKPVEKVEVISDDIELITTDEVKPIKPILHNLAAPSDQQPTSTTSETVDLTLSDSDEDDMPLAKRRTTAKQSAVSSSTTNGGIGSTSTNQRSNNVYMQQQTKTDREQDNSDAKNVTDVNNRVNGGGDDGNSMDCIPLSSTSPSSSKTNTTTNSCSTTTTTNTSNSSSSISTDSSDRKCNEV